MSSTERFSTVDVLRGVAACSVAYFHFTRGQDSLLGRSGNYGYLGVEAFFVISGFIIPYSMARAGYEARTDWLGFIIKRVVRLDPPYIGAIIFFVVTKYALALVPGYPGSPPHYSPTQLLLHLGYLNAFFHYEWVDLVYWSLAIEFQYYLVVALVLPLVVHESTRVRLLAMSAFVLGAMPVRSIDFVPHYFALFALGITTFQYRQGLLTRAAYLYLMLPIAAVTAYTLGIPEMLAGTATALAIAFVRIRAPGPLIALGAISYSLYLLHVPVGGRVMNFVSRLPLTGAVPIGLVCSMAAAIAAAMVYHRMVERPAQRWSSRLSYGCAARRAPSVVIASGTDESLNSSARENPCTESGHFGRGGDTIGRISTRSSIRSGQLAASVAPCVGETGTVSGN